MLRLLDESYDICHEMQGHHQCQMCGRCCHQERIVVLDSDLERMAGFLGMALRPFILRYLFRERGHWFLKETGPCAFLGEDNRCSIHEARPEACRVFPYESSKLMSRVYLTLRDPEASLDLEYMDREWPCTRWIQEEAPGLLRRRREV